MRIPSLAVVLAVFVGTGTPAAFAEENPTPAPSPERSARSVPVPESLPVVRADAGRTGASASGDASAWLVGGPGEQQGPAPCGPCRVGYDDCGRPRWGGNLWLGGWLWGQTGTLGVRGQEADVDTSLSDSIDTFQEHGDGALTGGGRVDYGRCFLQAWISYIHLEGEKDVLPTGEPVEASIEGLTGEVVAGYRVKEVALGCSPCSPCLAFEPYAGARYNGIELRLKGPRTSVKEEHDWWDPIVGCNFAFDFRNRWFTDVSVSVGGFGVASDFTWGLRAHVGYMFSRHVGAFAGLAAIGWDYEDGDFEYDLTQWGPYLGLVVTF